MLPRLRQHRRCLAGSFGFLFVGAWLGLALAPCLAMAQADVAATPTTGIEHDCPHCGHVEAPCADAAAPDCDPPLALASTDPERAKPVKFVALPATAGQPSLPPAHARAPRQSSTGVDPPHPPFTVLHCRFQE